MQFVPLLTMNYDMTTPPSLLCLWKRQDYVYTMKTESSGQMLAVFMMIKWWNILRSYHDAKHCSLVSLHFGEMFWISTVNNNEGCNHHMNQKFHTI